MYQRSSALRRKPSDPACVVAFVPPDLTYGTSDGPHRLITLGHEERTFLSPFPLIPSATRRRCEVSVDVNSPLIVYALAYTPSCSFSLPRYSAWDRVTILMRIADYQC